MLSKNKPTATLLPIFLTSLLNTLNKTPNTIYINIVATYSGLASNIFTLNSLKYRMIYSANIGKIWMHNNNINLFIILSPPITIKSIL